MVLSKPADHASRSPLCRTFLFNRGNSNWVKKAHKKDIKDFKRLLLVPEVINSLLRILMGSW